MNEVHIYSHRLYAIVVLLLGLGVMTSAWCCAEKWFENKRFSQGLILGGAALSGGAIWKITRRRPKITLTLHGVQFFYPTQRVDDFAKQTRQNQFIAWEDIYQVHLKRRQLQLTVDDNPPDYERLTDIELANLPPREMRFYRLNAGVGGLNVSADALTDCLGKMQRSDPRDRSALILSFHYNK